MKKFYFLLLALGLFTSLNAPKEVIAKTEGKLVKLFAVEGKNVNANEVIGYVESRAMHNEVIELSKVIETLQNSNDFSHLQNFTALQNLGEVQQSYQVFILALNNYKQTRDVQELVATQSAYRR